jgi:glycosyltransferase involved in cell wall biosynthesis
MKFSVLLPTRNRLELLRYAVETVRKQSYQDWEIIISDNDSEQDIKGFVDALGDSRIKYFRTDRFIPVTENWNLALGKSTGNYIIMLGDDDCLLQGYFATMDRLIRKFSAPDFIYTSAYLYAYPGVLPEYPKGFLQPYGYASFFRPSDDAYWLDTKTAREVVKKSLNFRVCFGYNMQYFTIRRSFIESLTPQGEYFQSPYPDYYAANVSFLKAERILVYPKPVVAIGISPKSFGYYFFNDQEKSGVEFLNNFPDRSVMENLQNTILPGTDMNTFWLIAMETVKNKYGSQMKLDVNRARYRFLQIFQMARKYFKENNPADINEWQEFNRLLTTKEKLLYALPLRIYYKIMHFSPYISENVIVSRIIRLLASHPQTPAKPLDIHCETILDVFENFATNID